MEDNAQASTGIVKNHLEYDDGILQYDIEFVKGQTEYEYDINATKGAII